MKRMFFVMATLFFSHCAVFKKEKSASLQQQHTRQESTVNANLVQQWQRLDSSTTDEMVWIKPLGQVKLDSNGFTGQASAIYWRKKQQQMELMSGASHQSELVVSRQALSLKEKASSLQRQTKSWPWLWAALLLLALLALLVRYLSTTLRR